MSEKKIVLAGNPNVGKSTIFNKLTGLNQHTGNWPGKTVDYACGSYEYNGEKYLIYDLPGTYSLNAHSSEEEISSEFICFGNYDVVVIVVDAINMERNLNLVLQILEVTNKAVLCINLMDQAKNRKIKIDLEKMAKILKIPVVGTSAGKQRKLTDLLKKIYDVDNFVDSFKIDYDNFIEENIKKIERNLNVKRWMAVRILMGDEFFVENLIKNYNLDEQLVYEQIKNVKISLLDEGINKNSLNDYIVKTINNKSKEIYDECITINRKLNNEYKFDRIITNKWIGLPFMLGMLAIIFWITIVGSNYPSDYLYNILFKLGDYLRELLIRLNSPSWLVDMLINGVYQVLAWVVSVMLPPMMIFFPLFSLLEESGFLPRIAFNLDKYFRKCYTCGKQALTMAMGFGCNAVGVTGCRIIDSAREKLIAILTNTFVPCNGRFPTLIALISIFIVKDSFGVFNSFVNVLILIIVILIGIMVTFLISKVLSVTILKGIPSSFILELPPYRKPMFMKVIFRSIKDKAIFVLGRALVVSAPAGLLIYVLASINVGDISLLKYISLLLDNFASYFGMDGVILLAFILGFPANEIVFPIMLMIYLSTGQMVEVGDLNSLREVLISNGWTITTGICVMLFSLIHFPCSTTCLTIKKETNSWKWTLLGIIIPTVTGLIICFLVSNVLKVFL